MKRLSLFLIAGDTVTSFLALGLAHMIRFGERPGPEYYNSLDGVLKIALFTFSLIFISFLAEFYNLDRLMRNRERFIYLVLSLSVSILTLSVFYYIVPEAMIGRGVLAIALLIFGLLQFLCHAGYRTGLNHPGFASRVLVLGTGPLAREIGGLVATTGHNHVLTGYYGCPNEPKYVPDQYIVGNGNNLVSTAIKEKTNKIVVSLSERRGSFPIEEVLDCKFSGIEVIDAPSFYEQVTGKLMIESITPSWFIFSNGFKVNGFRRILKRITDVILSVVGIVLVLPFLPFIALSIKLTSPGPILFRQIRVGEREKTFMLYKFRTMRQDAESRTGAVWAQKDDPRITPLGKFLRTSRLDELPQLYNVLKGDMSLVGPRPERPEFVEKLKEIIPYYSERHFVKPGATGWAQVKYAYGASVEDAIEKLRYDLYYIKNMSLFLDILIVMETIKVVLFGRGSR